MPSSFKISRGEDGPEEFDDKVDDAEEDNDHVNPVNNCKISVPETYTHSHPVNKGQSFVSNREV